MGIDGFNSVYCGEGEGIFSDWTFNIMNFKFKMLVRYQSKNWVFK
jgi:hypothetical protein